MDFDPTIPLQVKTPTIDDALKPVSSFLNIQNSATQLQQHRLDLEKNQENWKRLGALRDLANDSSVKNPDGSVNMDKYTAKAYQIDPLQGAELAKGGLSNQSQQISNETNRFALDKSYMQTALETASGLMNDPRINAPEGKYNDKAAADALEEAHSQMIAKGVPKSQALLAVAPYVNAVHTPGAVQQMLKNTVLGGMASPSQASAVQPTYADNGQQLTNINPFSQSPPIQKQLPPTTPTIQGNTPGYLGPQGNDSESGPQGLDVSKLAPQQVQALAQRDPSAFARGVSHFQQTSGNQGKGGFVPSGLPVGAEGNLQNNVVEMSRHYGSLQDASTGAALQLGLTKNIKSLADSAATGTLAGRQAYMAGLMNAFGIHATGDLQKDTDLLNKQMAQLNLSTPATTDAMRTLIEAGRPNTHMSAAAIKEAADQVAGQISANMAVRNYLTPYKYSNNGQGDPQGYQAARQVIEKIADPRAFQFAMADTEGKKAMLQKLSPEDRKDLRSKIEQLHSMGLVK